MSDYTKQFVIVLDLDNTLIFSTDNEIHVRCETTLRQLGNIRQDNIKIVVWCAGSACYTAEIVYFLQNTYGLHIDLILSGTDCELVEEFQRRNGIQEHKKPGYYVLEKLNLSPLWTFLVIVDDRLENSLSGYNARLWIVPFVPFVSLQSREHEDEIRDWGEGEIIKVYTLKHAINTLKMLYGNFLNE